MLQGIGNKLLGNGKTNRDEASEGTGSPEKQRQRKQNDENVAPLNGPHVDVDVGMASMPDFAVSDDAHKDEPPATKADIHQVVVSAMQLGMQPLIQQLNQLDVKIDQKSEKFEEKISVQIKEVETKLQSSFEAKLQSQGNELSERMAKLESQHLTSPGPLGDSLPCLLCTVPGCNWSPLF